MTKKYDFTKHFTIKYVWTKILAFSWQWRCRPAQPSSTGRLAACAWESWWFCPCTGEGSQAGSQPELLYKQLRESGDRPHSKTDRLFSHLEMFHLELPGQDIKAAVQFIHVTISQTSTHSVKWYSNLKWFGFTWNTWMVCCWTDSTANMFL